MSRDASRTLAGLWLSKTDRERGADSLRAATDEAMRVGGMLFSVLAVQRFEVARALRRRGAPADVERYLMWPDASTNITRNVTVRFSISPLVQYERGVALEEAGDRAAAARQLRRFLQSYDQPPPAHRALVEDATRRLAQIERTDAPARPPR